MLIGRCVERYWSQVKHYRLYSCFQRSMWSNLVISENCELYHALSGFNQKRCAPFCRAFCLFYQSINHSMDYSVAGARSPPPGASCWPVNHMTRWRRKIVLIGCNRTILRFSANQNMVHFPFTWSSIVYCIGAFLTNVWTFLFSNHEIAHVDIQTLSV